MIGYIRNKRYYSTRLNEAISKNFNNFIRDSVGSMKKFSISISSCSRLISRKAKDLT